MTRTLDVTVPGGWQPSAPMEARYHHSLVVLPTGEVLALGGQKSRSLNYLPDASVRTPQIWNPNTGQWSDSIGHDRLAENKAVRNYHSAALLLPDGRVLCSGGEDNNIFEYQLDVFCPPYLFIPGSDPPELAARPVITSAPDRVTYGESFTIDTPTPDSIASVCLIRSGASTHSFDQNQRYVPLIFGAETRSTLRAVAPTSGSLAPPGDYLLFILDRHQVPAVARWIRLGECPSIPCDTDAPPPVTSLAPDLVGPDRAWVAWDAPGDETSPLAGVFDVRYAAGGIDGDHGYDEATPAEEEPAVAPAGRPMSFAVGPLAPCTRYDVALKTRDGALGPANWSPLSNVTTVTTLCGEVGGPSANRMDGAAGAGPLAVETRRTPEGGWQVTVRRLAGEEMAAVADPGGIASQVPDGLGGWRTLGRHRPSPGTSPLGLCALRDGGRLVLPAGYALDRVAGAMRAGGRTMRLGLARHSRRGGLDELSADDRGIDIGPRDVLTLDYAPADDAAPGSAGWYLLVHPTGGSNTPGDAGEHPLASRIPTRFALHANQPNPFRHATTITFDMPVAGSVTLDVFDLLGRKVATLARGPHPAGAHTVEWHLRDAGGAIVRPGVYVCRFAVGTFVARSKMSVIP
jgi:hypothetical protein